MEEKKADVQMWHRGQPYALDDGKLFTARGLSRESYPLWADYIVWKSSAKQSGRAPYQALLDLVFDLQGKYGEKLYEHVAAGEQPSALAKKVQTWCDKHGLLGILPQQLILIQRPPVWKKRAGQMVPHVHVDMRRVGGWCGRNIPVTNWLELLGEARRNLTPPEDSEPVISTTPPEGWPGERVVLWPLTLEIGDIQNCIGFRRKGIDATNVRSDYVNDFFLVEPDTDEPSEILPTPYGDDFWNRYCEPLEEFYHVAHRFYVACQELAEAQSGGVTDDSLSLREGLLADLASTVRSPISTGDDVEAAYWAPSLLAAYAFMVLEDAKRPNTLHFCPECARVFASRARRAQFCSKRCRNTNAQRRFRAAKKL